MKVQRFSLKPFPSSYGAPDLSITGDIHRSSGKIEITYEIHGDIRSIDLQEEESPMRMDKLWKETCLEVFIEPEGSDHYWEVNLSPGGHWNVYRFTAYREGMKEEPALPVLPASVDKGDSALTLSANIDMDNLISPEKSLHVGISAVIKSRKGALSYWALTHPGPEPDFHSRKCFLIQI